MDLKVAPNLVNGSTILLKSLFDKLLSPINLIGLVLLTNRPKINLPSVPEFFALIVVLTKLQPFLLNSASTID